MYNKSEETHFKKEIKTMLTTKFGIEIEFTGITRKEAAETAAEFLGGRHQPRIDMIHEIEKKNA